MLNLIGAAVAGAAGFGVDLAGRARARRPGPGRRVPHRAWPRSRSRPAWPSSARRRRWCTGRPGCGRSAPGRNWTGCLQHGTRAGGRRRCRRRARASGSRRRRLPPAMAGPLRVLAVFLPLAVLTDALLAAARGYRVLRPTVVLDRLFRPALQLAGARRARGAGRRRRRRCSPPPGPRRTCRWCCSPGTRSAGCTRWTPAPAAPTCSPPRAYWTFTAPRAVASVAQIALQRVDVLLLAALGGLHAAGLYAVAGKYVVLSQVAGGGLSQAVQPRLAERLAVDDVDGVRALYQQATAWLILATWPLHLHRRRATRPSTSDCSDRPIGTVRPSCGSSPARCSWPPAAAWSTWCCRWAGAPAGTSTTCSPRWPPWSRWTSLLIPLWGAVGAALGLAAAVLVNNLVPLAQIWRTLGVHPFGRPTLQRRRRWRPGACGVPPLLATAAGAGPAAVAATSAAGAICFLAGAYRMRRRLNLHLLRGKSMRADYAEIFQSTENVDKYTDVVYAPGSYASHVNTRQRPFPARPGGAHVPRPPAGAARLRLRHRAGDPVAARAGAHRARLRPVGRDAGEGREAGALATLHQIAAGRPGAGTGHDGRSRAGDDVPPAAQRPRRGSRPGDRVRRRRPCPRRTPGCSSWRTTATGSSLRHLRRAPARRRRLVLRAVARRGASSCSTGTDSSWSTARAFARPARPVPTGGRGCARWPGLVDDLAVPGCRSCGGGGPTCCTWRGADDRVGPRWWRARCWCSPPAVPRRARTALRADRPTCRPCRTGQADAARTVRRRAGRARRATGALLGSWVKPRAITQPGRIEAVSTLGGDARPAARHRAHVQAPRRAVLHRVRPDVRRAVDADAELGRRRQPVGGLRAGTTR